MLETKLSPNKVRKMISQFKSGKIFMEKITDKKYLFIGFLKAEKFESYVKKKVEGIEFIKDNWFMCSPVMWVTMGERCVFK